MLVVAVVVMVYTQDYALASELLKGNVVAAGAAGAAAGSVASQVAGVTSHHNPATRFRHIPASG